MPKEVLIADSNVVSQEAFEKIFEGMDYQLVFAENGEDALLKVKLYKPELVIADVTMPVKDGFELCKIVKSDPELKRIPFVLLAGIFEDIEKSEQDRVGADGIITKPLKTEEILPLVDDLLNAVDGSQNVGAPGPSDQKSGGESVKTKGEERLQLDSVSAVGGWAEAQRSSEPPRDPLNAGEDQGIIDLTEVVEEEIPRDISYDEKLGDISLQPSGVGNEGSALDEKLVQGLYLDESREGLEQEELELVDEVDLGAEAGSVGEAGAGAGETPGLEVIDDGILGREDRKKAPVDKALEAELEEEIDRRIDSTLLERGRGKGAVSQAKPEILGMTGKQEILGREDQKKAPVDKALEAELEEEIDRRIDSTLWKKNRGEGAVFQAKPESEEGTAKEEGPGVSIETGGELSSATAVLGIGPLTEEAAQGGQVGEEPEEPEDEADTVIDLEEDESLAEDLKSLFNGKIEGLAEGIETEPEGGLSEASLQEASSQPSEPIEGLFETVEEGTSAGDLKGGSADLEELSLEDLVEIEGVEEEDLEALSDEGEAGILSTGEIEKITVEELEEPPMAELEPEESQEAPIEGDLETAEISGETPESERPEEAAGEEPLTSEAEDALEEAIDLEVLENLAEDFGAQQGKDPLGKEEGVEKPEGVLDLGVPNEEPTEPVSFPEEVSKEEPVSEEEVEAFAKRFAGTQGVPEPVVPAAPEPAGVFSSFDDRIEALIRKVVSELLGNISERVVPELAKTIVEAASKRIEKVVEQVVPELAEDAIRKEIERLQKGG